MSCLSRERKTLDDLARAAQDLTRALQSRSLWQGAANGGAEPGCHRQSHSPTPMLRKGPCQPAPGRSRAGPGVAPRITESPRPQSFTDECGHAGSNWAHPLRRRDRHGDPCVSHRPCANRRTNPCEAQRRVACPRALRTRALGRMPQPRRTREDATGTGLSLHNVSYATHGFPREGRGGWAAAPRIWARSPPPAFFAGRLSTRRRSPTLALVTSRPFASRPLRSRLRSHGLLGFPRNGSRPWRIRASRCLSLEDLPDVVPDV